MSCENEFVKEKEIMHLKNPLHTRSFPYGKIRIERPMP